jgi:hypothetical protein
LDEKERFNAVAAHCSFAREKRKAYCSTEATPGAVQDASPIEAVVRDERYSTVRRANAPTKMGHGLSSR